MPLPRYSFNAPAPLLPEMLELWRESRREVYDVAPTSGDFSESAFNTTAFRVDNIVLSRSHGRNISLRRCNRHLHGDVCGFVRLKYVSGTQYSKCGEGERVRSSSNALSIVDFSRPMDLAVKEADELGVYIPHAMIDYSPGDMPAQMNICLNSAAGRILKSTMVSTFETLPYAGLHDAPSIAAGFSGLLRGLLAGGALSDTEATMSRARARSMRDFLEQRLSQPDLDVSALEQAFGASRATIFRDFAEYGGVSRYIMVRRLERAFADLASNFPFHGAVTRAAEHWGFATVGHFSRNFREHFGFPPSSAVGAWTDHQGSGAEIGRRRNSLRLGIDGDPACLEHWLSHLAPR